jgi:hypothetical protein
MTFNQMFQWMALLFFASLLLIPLVKRVSMTAGGPAH